MTPGSRVAARLAIGAALYAALEIGLTLTLGRFFAWGRAEALLFFAFRPWCLLLAAILAARWRGRERIGLYAAALGLASVSEGMLLAGLGADDPAPELLRGIAGGAALLLLYELLIQGGRRLHRRIGMAGGVLLILPFLLLPNGLRPYDELVLAEPPGMQGPKPRLLVMTGLPLIWGATSSWTLEPRPVEAYQALQAEYDLRPLDTLDDAGLEQGRLLLLAQPRLLAPAELVRLDAWVRTGGRALILTDPLLLWPSDIPPGDARRGPPVGLLGPLLAHWGLTLDPADLRGVAVHRIEDRRLIVAAPGAFAARAGSSCAVEEKGLVARCRIGKGEAILVADADLLHDGLWAGPGAGGDARHRRIADNPLVVADWLDGLAGLDRERAQGNVIWRDPEADARRAILLALLPVVIVGGAGLTMRLRPRNT